MYILNLKYFIAKKCYSLYEFSVSHDLFAVGTSKITDHYSKYSNNEKFDIFWGKFDILPKLPKCDTET